MRRVYILLFLFFTFAMASTVPVFAQRADRGFITGVVSDPSGAAVPQATVSIINEDTGIHTPVSTTDAGNYGSPPLVLGKYTVRVEKEGFKTFVRSGILLEGGITYRQDAALELGAIAQTVEVKAASEMINVSTAEVGHSLGAKYYQDLPVVMGADIRLAEALLQAQPGFVPMEPNGDAMFRGSQFNSRINGGQTLATENWMDGAAFGYAIGHQQTQESSVPFDSVREMKVINSSFSAQYGHTSGAFIEYVSKSGTNDFHGGVYEYLGNHAMNARRFFEYDKTGPGTARNPTKNNDYGFLVGGPVWKDKTHFFTNLTWFKLRQVVSSGFVWNVPTQQIRDGDFSPYLDLTNQIDTDALGRPIYDGQVFDPSTTRQVTAGVVDPLTNIAAVSTGPVREPFAGNIIPGNHPLRSQIAANYIPLIPKPDRAGLNLNSFGGFGDPNKIMDIWTWLVRIDHSFSPSLKTSGSYWMNERPTIRKCGSPGACDVPSDPRVDSTINDQYISDGFVQRIANRNMHQQFDWVIKPTIFNHTTFSYDRWYMGGWSISDGVGWLTKLGIQGLPVRSDQAGPPHMDWQGGKFGYTDLGTNWGRGFEAINRWQIADDMTWITGRHTIKLGFEFRWHENNQAGWARGFAGYNNFNEQSTGGFSGAGNILLDTGDPLASMMLGQVWDAGFPLEIDTSFTEKYWAPWVNDEIKVNDKLTINFGLRWDYQAARRERHNRFSNFDPTLANPGAGGLPGAMAFADASNPTFDQPPRDAWGPRAAFAYKLTDKDVIRGGYGIYYSGVQMSMWAAMPSSGYNISPTATSVLGLATPSPLQPTFYWDDGFPQGYLQNLPPFIDPTVSNNREPLAIQQTEGLALPRYQNWSLAWERQLSGNTMLEVAYVANHATRLITNRSSAGFPGHNNNNPDVLDYGIDLLRETDFNDPAVVAAGITMPYAGFTGNVAQALRPFPQYGLINWRDLRLGNSNFQSLQTKLEKRFSNGLQFRIAHVWSKLIATGEVDSGNSNAWNRGPQNPICTMKCERALSEDDLPQTLILAYTYQFPFGSGKRFGANTSSIVNKFIGGWGLSGMHRYQSGRPLGITMDNDLGEFLYTWSKRPNKLKDGGWTGGKFDPNTDKYLDYTAWANPGALEFGNAPRTDGYVRTFPVYNEDVSIIKDTHFRGEKYKLRFEAQFGNLLNRTFFCPPNTNWSAGPTAFGTTGGQCNVPRRIQMGLRFDF